MKSLLPSVLVLFIGSGLWADEVPHLPWMHNVEEAKGKAAKEGKDLFINFTGSDWCPWCKVLEGEVFSQAEFIEKVSDRFVFLFLDFPNDPELKAKVVDPELNAKMRDALSVKGFPTIVITDASGLPYARTGYEKGGPAKYVEHLDDLAKDGVAVKRLLQAKNVDAKVLTPAFRALTEHGLLGFEGYARFLAKAREIDKSGDLGLLEHVLTLEESQAFEKLMKETLPVGQHPSLEQWAKIEQFIGKSKHLHGMEFAQIAASCAVAFMEAGKFATAKPLLERAKSDPALKELADAQKWIAEKLAECAQGMQEGDKTKGGAEDGDG